MPVRPLILSALCAAAAFSQMSDAALNMQAIAQALGVSCDYCHSPQGAARAPEPEPKKDIARQMIAMTRELNLQVQQATGKPSAKVECVTCHHGVPIPRQLSDILTETLRSKGADAAVGLY